jgi:hypothetical protein
MRKPHGYDLRASACASTRDTALSTFTDFSHVGSAAFQIRAWLCLCTMSPCMCIHNSDVRPREDYSGLTIRASTIGVSLCVHPKDPVSWALRRWLACTSSIIGQTYRKPRCLDAGPEASRSREPIRTLTDLLDVRHTHDIQRRLGCSQGMIVFCYVIYARRSPSVFAGRAASRRISLRWTLQKLETLLHLFSPQPIVSRPSCLHGVVS